MTPAACERPDLDTRAAAHYGCDVPVLTVGDKVRVHDRPTDVYVVEGFASGGMMVDVIRTADGQEFCLPRKYVSRDGKERFLVAQIDGSGAS